MTVVYKTHDPSRDVMLVSLIPMTGFEKGDYISIDTSTPRNKTVMGAMGDGQFVESKDNSGTITLKIMSYSQANSILSALFKSGVPFPVVYKKNGSLTVFSTGAAKIEKLPPIVGSDEPKALEWKIIFISGEGAQTGATPI
jgi:hypothetical protein